MAAPTQSGGGRDRPHTFWSESQSYFRSTCLTTFIDHSPEFALPVSLAPHPPVAGRVFRRPHGLRASSEGVRCRGASHVAVASDALPVGYGHLHDRSPCRSLDRSRQLLKRLHHRTCEKRDDFLVAPRFDNSSGADRARDRSDIEPSTTAEHVGAVQRDGRACPAGEPCGRPDRDRGEDHHGNERRSRSALTINRPAWLTLPDARRTLPSGIRRRTHSADDRSGSSSAVAAASAGARRTHGRDAVARPRAVWRCRRSIARRPLPRLSGQVRSQAAKRFVERFQPFVDQPSDLQAR